MTCKVFVFFLVSILCCFYDPLIAQSLSGNYTIGNADGTEDYPTLSAAIADLKSGTITGDIELNISNGTYNETMDLSGINNGNFTITFSGANKDFTIIHPMGNIAANKSGISISNTNNIVLEKFTLVMDDISSSRVFYDENETKGISISNASNIDLENLILSNSKHVFSQSQRVYIASAVSLVDVEAVTVKSCDLSGAGFLIRLDDFETVSISDSEFSEGQMHIWHSRTVENDADGLTIQGNTFTGPFPTGRSAAAISLFGRGGTASSYSSNLVIKDNVIDTKVAASDDGIIGIYAQGQADAEVSNNKIYDGSFGIRFDGSFSSVLASNEVYGPSNYGLYLQLGGQLDVINNIFTSSNQTAFISAPADIRLAHNTLYASGTQPALRIFREGGDSLVVVNNIFSVENTVGSEVVITDVTADDIRIDHNLYSGNANTYTIAAYRLGADIGQINGLEYYASSLNDWQANQTSYDQNSQSFIPTFAGAQDLHITDASSYRYGTPIEFINSDIDGDYRDVKDGIDVGADQYCNPTCLPPAPPAVSSFTPTSGPIGSVIFINGANFESTPADNVVTIGGVQATVLTASPTLLSVEIPAGAASGPVSVLANGLIGQSGVSFHVAFDSDGTIADEGFAISDVLFPERRLDRFDMVTLASGDMDGDGLVDLITANRSDSSVAIYRNISTGYDNISFENRLIFPTAGEPNELVLEDFDGDGKLDIAVGQEDRTHFSVFRNTSTTGISMADRQDFQTPGHTFSIAAGDLDGDGKIDLATIIKDSSELILFKNTSTIGSIRFSNQGTYSTDANPVDLKVADVDQDQVPDVVVISNSEQSLSVFLNDGAMNLAPQVDFNTGSQPNYVTAGDIDGDGVLDLAVATQSGIRIFGNSSSVGSLNFSSQDVGNTATKRLLFSDINGDNAPDLVSIDGDIKIKENTSSVGAISFDTEVAIVPEVGTVSLHVSDFNHDGEPDIATSGWASSFFDFAVEIFRNFGSGNSFTSFSLEEQLAPAVIDAQNHTITIEVIACQDLTSLIPEFELSPNATTTVASVSQQSGVTANDYSSSVTYVVTAEDGVTENWTVTVSTGLVDNIVETLEACESYEFDGNTLTTSGQYFGSFTNMNGCDSLVTLNLTILDPSSGHDAVTVCESYEWEGTVYTASGVYQEILTNAVGCDSTATLNLTILEATSGNDAVTVCESYEWEGTVYTTSGIYQEILTNAVGCDSTATLNLTILEPTSGDDAVTVCESYEWEGMVYTASGTYQEILTNSVGCDSTATLNLTILEPTSGDDDIEACVSYEWEGMVYTASGTYQEILTNAVGCDSTATLNLTILEATSGNDAVTVCESYEWEGTVYTTSGIYQEILTNAVGCDSTATLNLTILEPTSGDDAVTVCESYEWEGMVYTASGTYQEILTNSVGCDSTATLNLTILEPTSGDDDIEACVSYEWEGMVYTASGTYQEILTNAVGCDSTATLNLTILEPTSGSATIDACESYEWEGNVYTSSGTYQKILTNSVGCDSTATLKLSILEPSSGVAKVTVCDSYEWEGTVYTTSGVYQEILTNAVGCDSTVTLNLTVLGSTTGEKEVSVCESYKWQGTVYTTSGTYQEVLTNSVGCDSTATLKLTILEPTTGVEEVEACGSYEWEGTIYTTSGTYQEILTNAAGCDSTATLNLSILESTFSFEEVEACDSYEWNDQVLTENGIHEIMLTNAVGCDSLAIIDLTLLESTFGEETVVACGSYEWEGERFESSGIYEMILAGSNGCDSVATLNLTIGQEELHEVIMDVCSGYTFGSQQITSSGLYQETFSNSLGCDSTVLLTAEVFDAPVNGIIRSGATLMAEDNSEGMVYQWYDCSTDQKLEGETNKEFIPDSNGDYSLEISNGVCSVQTTCFSYSREDNVLSSDREGSVVSVYPNPTSEKVQVTFPKGDKSDIVIFGLDGRIIVEADVSGQTRFEYTLPEPGLYLLQINSSSGQQDFIKVLRK